LTEATPIPIRIEPAGQVQVDGVTVFRRLVRPDGVYIQFVDRDRMRSACRGSRYIEIPLSRLIQLLGGT